MFYGYEISTRQRLVWRAVALVASIAVNAVLSMGLMVMFHSSSSLPWLAPTEANLALLASCNQGLGTSARRTCVEQVVASVQARDASVRVAERSKASDAGRP